MFGKSKLKKRIKDLEFEVEELQAMKKAQININVDFIKDFRSMKWKIEDLECLFDLAKELGYVRLEKGKWVKKK